MIHVKNLCHEVANGNEPLVILNHLSFDIMLGESVAITGSSGSGKTTLLSLLAGLEVPTSGEIMIAGEAISHMTEDERAAFRAKQVGFVFQAFHLLSGLTALENVALPLELLGNKHAREIASDYLSSVGLEKRLQHYPSQLSGGEQQRVALARAFSVEPDILFADEPTGNLDQQTGARIIDLLFKLNQETQTTLVLVTHEQRLAECCQRQFYLSDRKMVEVYTS